MIEALVLKQTEAGVVATNDPDDVGFSTELLQELVEDQRISQDADVISLPLADEIRRYRVTKVDGPITIASRIRD